MTENVGRRWRTLEVGGTQVVMPFIFKLFGSCCIQLWTYENVLWKWLKAWKLLPSLGWHIWRDIGLSVFAYVCVFVCVCVRCSVCHRALSFPFTAPWQQCQTRPHMICVCLWEYVCVCVWVDTVFILLSNPFHLRSLGCSRVLPNGQSRPTKLAFGSGTELDA